MVGLWIILLLLLYWLFGQVLRRANCAAMYDRMGDSEVLWFFLLGCAIVLLYL